MTASLLFPLIGAHSRSFVIKLMRRFPIGEHDAVRQ